MKLKLVAAISALAIPALAHAQQGGPQQLGVSDANPTVQ